jgi:hypothetical protein
VPEPSETTGATLATGANVGVDDDEEEAGVDDEVGDEVDVSPDGEVEPDEVPDEAAPGTVSVRTDDHSGGIGHVAQFLS